MIAFYRFVYLNKNVCREQNLVPTPKVKVTTKVQRSAGEIHFRSITFEPVDQWSDFDNILQVCVSDQEGVSRTK